MENKFSLEYKSKGDKFFQLAPFSLFYMQLVTPKAVPRAVRTVMRNWMMFFQTFLLIVIVDTSEAVYITIE